MLLRGPRGWIIPSLLMDATSLGFSGGASDLEALSLAARFRVATFEARSEGGLRVQHMIWNLGRSMRNSDDIAKLAAWGTWFQGAMVTNLDMAVQHFHERGWDYEDVRQKIVGARDIDAQQMENLTRTMWQRTRYNILQTIPSNQNERFLRSRVSG